MEEDISNDDRIAFAEVDYIIHHMNKIYLDKIPQKVKDYITILKKRNIKINIDFDVPLEQQGLKECTLYFLMILNLKYWCDDKKRKNILSILEKNQKKYNEKVNKIFDNDKLVSENNKDLSLNKQMINSENTDNFKNTNDLSNNIEAIVEVKEESFFIKLLNKIKNYFTRK